MARPIKKGLDYYPKNVDIYEDRKIRKLLKEFGSKGALVYDYLLCLIYRDNGYYVEYDGELAFDIADYLGCGLTEDLVKEIVKGCVRVGLFNKRLHDMSSILTSSGIQNRYVLVKRTAVIDAKIRVNAAETPVNEAESTQSKEKESKGNELMKNFTIDHCKLDKGTDEYLVIESSIKLYNGFCKEFPLNRDLPLMEKKDWILPVRELMQRKKYTYDQIADVLNYAVGESFWRKIIMNTQSLAKHFETIKAQYQQKA